MNYAKTFIASALIAGSTLVSAEVQWLAPQANDLHPTGLETDTRSVPASMHHESASINFAWTPDQATDGRIPAVGPTAGTGDATVESRQYWLDTSGSALARGIELPISAPGAVIRLSVLESDPDVSLDPERLALEINGRPVDAEFGPDQIRTGDDLRAEGMSVPEDTLAFRLPQQIEAGTLRVSLPGVPAGKPLVVHVYEPDSEWVARLSLPRHSFLSGQPLEFELTLGDGRRSLAARSIQAVLASPDASQTWPIQAGRGNGLSVSAAPVAERSQPGQGLYEAHVYVESEFNGQTIRRDLVLALNIAPAVARFNGQVTRGRSNGLGLELGVETAIDGRFQVNAEILGTNARGQLQQLGYVQSAAVLEAGSGTINLEIDQGMLRSSGLSAPFEVHNLQLLDQGRMYLLEDRERAMVIAR